MKKNIIQTIVFCVLLASSSNAIAQPGVEDAISDLEGTSADANAGTPINDYIIPMLLIGIGVGYRLLKQRKQLAK